MRGILLNVNDRVQVDASLTTGGVSEVVEVTGRTLVQTTTAVQNLIDSRQVQELPINNRNFAKLAELAPGVSSDLADEVSLGLTSTMSISVNGARRNAVNWLVDGVMNVDVGSNITLLSTPTLESIEQFKIITSSYAAEWPRSGGGIINVVTKSGTSRFAGSAYEFFRNDALNSNSYFRKQATDPAIRDNAPDLDYNNFGATIGGPLLKSKEKLFFFFSEELRRISRAPASLTALVPNPEWLTDPTSANYVAPAERDPIAVRLLSGYPAPNTPPLAPGAVGRYQVVSPNINNTRQEVVRVDYDFSNTQRLWGRYTHDLSETLELGGLFFNTPIPGVAGTDTRVPGQVGAVGLRTIIGSNRLNELNYHFSSNNINTQPAEGVRNTRSDFGVTIPEVFPENAGGVIPVIDVTGLSTLGANQPIRIEYLNHSVTRQLLVAARQPRLQDGRPRDLRAEERERREPQPGRVHVRRHDRRRHRVPELHARQSRRVVHRLQLHRGRARRRPGPALQPLRVLRAGHLAPDLAPDDRLRPALLAVSGDHR